MPDSPNRSLRRRMAMLCENVRIGMTTIVCPAASEIQEEPETEMPAGGRAHGEDPNAIGN